VLMVTHEPDIAAYASRQVRFVDGLLASDSLSPPAGLAPAAAMPAPAASAVLHPAEA